MSGEGARGWGAVLGLSVVAAAFSVVHPALLIFVPLSLLLLALPPRRPLLVLLGGVVVAAVMMGARGDALWFVERGWALVLGAWFLIVVAVWPAGPFLGRALAAVGASAGSAMLLLLAVRGGWERIDFAVARRLHSGATDWAGVLGPGVGAGGADGWRMRMTEGVFRAAELQAVLYPALLALASVAALGVAWWAYRRLAFGDRAPLRPLREFRFDDSLVWLVIVGVALVLLPLGTAWARAGTNVLLFMGALYALRGAAVLVALLGAPGPVGVILAALAVVFLYPLVVAATLLVGLSDTWLDLRRRRPLAQGPGA